MPVGPERHEGEKQISTRDNKDSRVRHESPCHRRFQSPARQSPYIIDRVSSPSNALEDPTHSAMIK